MSSALLLGASGLVGGHCLERLLVEPAYDRVVVLGRRPLPRDHPKLEQRVVDFDQLGDSADMFSVDHVFCCLGTTIRKAGSREAFRRVDLGYPRETARLAAGRGARRYLLVSAVGADPTSRIFYNRVKGEAEEAVQAFPFDAVVVLRPSLLLGDRDERRPGERLAEVVLRPLAPLMVGPLARYRPVQASAVAATLVQAALEGRSGHHVIESDGIRRAR